MFKRILVPTDGSIRAEHAARAAIELAKYLNASIVSLYVYPPFHVVVTEPFVNMPDLVSEPAYKKVQRTAAKRILGVIDQAAHAAGVPCFSLCVEHDSPAAAIVETAVSPETPCDLVFIGSHGRGLFSQVFLGSVTTKVQTLCDVPVLVYRDPQEKKVKAEKDNTKKPAAGKKATKSATGKEAKKSAAKSAKK